MSESSGAITSKFNHAAVRRHIIRSIWCLFTITLAGLIFGALLLLQISKQSGWQALLLDGPQTEVYSQSQTDKFITSVLITVQNQPMDQGGASADMIFIASFNAFEQRMTMVALSNEIIVNTEAHGRKTLGEVYAAGGPELLMNTLSQQFDIDLQNYACTATHSLASMIDLLGGIKVVLTPEEATYVTEALGESPATLPSDEVQLSGIQSMVHALDTRSDNQPLGNLARSLSLVHSAVNNMRATATKEAMLPLLSLIFSSIQTNLDLQTLRDLGYEILRADEIEYRNFVLPNAQNRKAGIKGRDELSIRILRDENLLRESLYGVE